MNFQVPGAALEASECSWMPLRDLLRPLGAAETRLGLLFLEHASASWPASATDSALGTPGLSFARAP